MFAGRSMLRPYETGDGSWWADPHLADSCTGIALLDRGNATDVRDMLVEGKL